MVLLEAKKALARKLNINFDDIANNDLFSEEDLEDYINTAGIKAWDYAFWDFAEHSKTGTLTGTQITNGYVEHPEDLAPSSIYYMEIGGKEFKKRNFSAYKKYLSENSSADDRIWAEFKRMIFFNTNSQYAVAGATFDVYGRRAYVQLTNDTDLLPFSPDEDNEEFSGNQAMIILAYAEALSSDKKKNPSQAQIEEKKAYSILDVLKTRLEEGRATEQEQNRPMFNVPDFFPRRNGGSNNSPIGGFSI